MDAARGAAGAATAERTPGFAAVSSSRRWAAGAVAAALGAAALADFGLGARGLISAGLVAVLVVLAVIDLEHRVIPNRIVLPAAGVVLLAQTALFSERWLEWVVASGGAALVLLLPEVLRAGAIGMGDVKLSLLLGAGLGREVVAGLLLGSIAAVPVSLWILATRGLEARKETIPLGPFLALGAIAALLLGTSLEP